MVRKLGADEWLRMVAVLGAIASIGMTTPQCSAVDRPLSSREDGFIDEDLFGHYSDIDFDYSIAPDGEFELTEAGAEPGLGALFHTWSTEINGRRYFNLPISRPADCTSCSPEELADLLGEPEAVYPFLYSTDVDSLDGPALDARYSLAELSQRHGEWIAYSWMDPDFSAEAVDRGLIAGQCEGSCSSSTLVRFTADRRTLRRFIAQHSDDLYLQWIVLWRTE